MSNPVNDPIFQKLKKRSDAGDDVASAIIRLWAELTLNPERISDTSTVETFKTWADTNNIVGPIKWDWYRWLPKGMLTILAGPSGSGKSMLVLHLSGCYLIGWALPNSGRLPDNTGTVIWCEAEAAQAVNLERARNWGLPLDRIITPLDDPLADFKLDNPEHVSALARLARRPDVRLIVVDSLRGAHSKDENNSETMELVKLLAALARDTNKPVLLTHHLRKRGFFDGDSVNLDRLRGSSAIVQSARVVWALDAPDPHDKEIRRLQVVKSNLSKFPEPVGLTINEKGITFVDAPKSPRTETVADKAADLLLALLSKGPKRAVDLEEDLKHAGISWASANRAKKKLGLNSIKKPDGWFWSLPVRQHND